MLRKIALASCLAAAGLAGVSACGKPRPWAIAVVPKGQAQSFWTVVRAGAVAAGRELGVEILWDGPLSETDAARQIRIVDDFIDRRVRGIVLAPANGASLVPVVERAYQEKIPVAIIDSGVGTDKYATYISSDNQRSGMLAARRLGSILAGEAKIAILGTLPGSVSTTERENGFRETLAREFPGLQVVASQFGMADAVRSADAAREILRQNPDLSGLYCSAEAGTLGAVEAALRSGRAGRVKIVGSGARPALLEHLAAGRIDALVVQNPYRMGYLGVKAVVDHLHGNPPAKRIHTGEALITRDNMASPEYREMLHPPALP